MTFIDSKRDCLKHRVFPHWRLGAIDMSQSVQSVSPLKMELMPLIAANAELELEHHQRSRSDVS
jgi:hypothetical protein